MQQVFDESDLDEATPLADRKAGRKAASVASQGTEATATRTHLAVRPLSLTAVIGSAAALAACGGGGGGGGSESAGTTSGGATSAQNQPPATNANPNPGSNPPGDAPLETPGVSPSTSAPPTPVKAARFLGQATFGATQAETTALTQSTLPAWIDAQIRLPASLHLGNVDAFLASTTLPGQGGRLGLIYSMWKVFATAPDQLRQRTAFALSEIFVIGIQLGFFFQEPRLGAGFMDVLTRNALGNFRKLLEEVTLSPAMGVYLSHVKNQKENPATGRMPDENYAREVLQLFSIGLKQLNQDGTPRLDGSGNATDTYSNADITGLAKVFTGFSWGGPDRSSNRFNLPLTSIQTPNPHDPNHEILPMQPYPQFHSVSEKKFLGATIPAQSSADPPASLKVALDTIFAHPNVPPFISKQLIQRLVSSNPSAAYVKRVADVFANNGKGVRGDLAAVVRAILLDDEARLESSATATTGKLREPAVRLVNWMRTFQATSASGNFTIDDTSDAATELGQSPLHSPSVFNFFRPGYIPPNSRAGAQKLVAPEFQITTETTVAGYLNFMRRTIESGAGRNNDVKGSYTYHLQLAANAVQLVDNLNLLLAGSRMTAARCKIISDEVNKVAATTDAGKLNRVKLAAFLMMASPEYILQN